jgi:hypothetical protein
MLLRSSKAGSTYREFNQILFVLHWVCSSWVANDSSRSDPCVLDFFFLFLDLRIYRRTQSQNDVNKSRAMLLFMLV